MAAFKRKFYDIHGLILLVLLGLPLISCSNIDCGGKPFRCVNSTHFMICVDLGGGVSTTIDNFIIPCPTRTVCLNTNRFECEFPPATTAAPIVSGDMANEILTTTIQEDIVTTNSHVIDEQTTFDTVSVTTVTKQETTEPMYEISTSIYPLPGMDTEITTESLTEINSVTDFFTTASITTEEAPTTSINEIVTSYPLPTEDNIITTGFVTETIPESDITTASVTVVTEATTTATVQEITTPANVIKGWPSEIDSTTDSNVASTVIVTEVTQGFTTSSVLSGEGSIVTEGLPSEIAVVTDSNIDSVNTAIVTEKEDTVSIQEFATSDYPESIVTKALPTEREYDITTARVTILTEDTTSVQEISTASNSILGEESIVTEGFVSEIDSAFDSNVANTGIVTEEIGIASIQEFTTSVYPEIIITKSIPTEIVSESGRTTANVATVTEDTTPVSIQAITSSYPIPGEVSIVTKGYPIEIDVVTDSNIDSVTMTTENVETAVTTSSSYPNSTPAEESIITNGLSTETDIVTDLSIVNTSVATENATDLPIDSTTIVTKVIGIAPIQEITTQLYHVPDEETVVPKGLPLETVTDVPIVGTMTVKADFGITPPQEITTSSYYVPGEENMVTKGLPLETATDLPFVSTTIVKEDIGIGPVQDITAPFYGVSDEDTVVTQGILLETATELPIVSSTLVTQDIGIAPIEELTTSRYSAPSEERIITSLPLETSTGLPIVSTTVLIEDIEIASVEEITTSRYSAPSQESIITSLPLETATDIPIVSTTIVTESIGIAPVEEITTSRHSAPGEESFMTSLPLQTATDLNTVSTTVLTEDIEIAPGEEITTSRYSAPSEENIITSLPLETATDIPIVSTTIVTEGTGITPVQEISTSLYHVPGEETVVTKGIILETETDLPIDSATIVTEGIGIAPVQEITTSRYSVPGEESVVTKGLSLETATNLPIDSTTIVTEGIGIGLLQKLTTSRYSVPTGESVVIKGLPLETGTDFPIASTKIVTEDIEIAPIQEITTPLYSVPSEETMVNNGLQTDLNTVDVTLATENTPTVSIQGTLTSSYPLLTDENIVSKGSPTETSGQTDFNHASVTEDIVTAAIQEITTYNYPLPGKQGATEGLPIENIGVASVYENSTPNYRLLGENSVVTERLPLKINNTMELNSLSVTAATEGMTTISAQENTTSEYILVTDSQTVNILTSSPVDDTNSFTSLSEKMSKDIPELTSASNTASFGTEVTTHFGSTTSYGERFVTEGLVSHSIPTASDFEKSNQPTVNSANEATGHIERTTTNAVVTPSAMFSSSLNNIMIDQFTESTKLHESDTTTINLAPFSPDISQDNVIKTESASNSYNQIAYTTPEITERADVNVKSPIVSSTEKATMIVDSTTNAKRITTDFNIISNIPISTDVGKELPTNHTTSTPRSVVSTTVSTADSSGTERIVAESTKFTSINNVMSESLPYKPTTKTENILSKSIGMNSQTAAQLPISSSASLGSTIDDNKNADLQINLPKHTLIGVISKPTTTIPGLKYDLVDSSTLPMISDTKIISKGIEQTQHLTMTTQPVKLNNEEDEREEENKEITKTTRYVETVTEKVHPTLEPTIGQTGNTYTIEPQLQSKAVSGELSIHNNKKQINVEILKPDQQLSSPASFSKPDKKDTDLYSSTSSNNLGISQHTSTAPMGTDNNLKDIVESQIPPSKSTISDIDQKPKAISHDQRNKNGVINSLVTDRTVGLNRQSENNHRESKVHSSFNCQHRNRGRYADNNDCKKFYICIGRLQPIEGTCPMNTVFSEIKKQCTKNLSHCIRNSKFQCVSQGRFSDVLNDNIYYICVKNRQNAFVRFKFQCQNGYHLNKTSVTCIQKSPEVDSTSVTEDSSVKEKSANYKKSDETKSKSKSFECKKEGKFADPEDCRKYYVCSKNKKSELRRRRKECDSDEVFNKEKKKCVDEDSYECQ